LPICRFAQAFLPIGNWQSAIGNNSLRLFVASVPAAATTELTEFQPIRRGLLILGRYVIPVLAFLTLKHNVIAWHNFISDFRLPIANLSASCLSNRQSAIGNRQFF
jgi:hypothetical protein